jgi:hypothetical protein
MQQVGKYMVTAGGKDLIQMNTAFQMRQEMAHDRSWFGNQGSREEEILLLFKIELQGDSSPMDPLGIPNHQISPRFARRSSIFPTAALGKYQNLGVFGSLTSNI